MDAKKDPLEELQNRLGLHLKSIGAFVPSSNPEVNNELVINELYARGYFFYESGKYLEATDFFKVLTQMSAQNPVYWIGLGACLQMQKKYNEALLAYTTALIHDTTDPTTFFHAANCCFALNHVAEGLVAVETAENIAREKPEYKGMLPQLALLKKTWSNEEKKENNPKTSVSEKPVA
ncbi:MAG: tetratricopeptide repeat protein [Parachlamydiaceae bacterium]|nr:tetratricopeptide repeat protein [Parachlamydiaceae bacterium]